MLLSAESKGYRIALFKVEAGRIGIAAPAVGMAQAVIKAVVAYARERHSFGRLIINRQAVGFRLADMAIRRETARQLVLHSAAVKEAGEPCLTRAPMANLFASEAPEAIASGAAWTLGGYGYLEQFGLAKTYRAARLCQNYEGTSDIQRMVTASSR